MHDRTKWKTPKVYKLTGLAASKDAEVAEKGWKKKFYCNCKEETEIKCKEIIWEHTRNSRKINKFRREQKPKSVQA